MNNHPPSITLIVYGIATETSIGRHFIAGIIPGIMLIGFFMLCMLLAIGLLIVFPGLATWLPDYMMALLNIELKRA